MTTLEKKITPTRGDVVFVTSTPSGYDAIRGEALSGPDRVIINLLTSADCGFDSIRKSATSAPDVAAIAREHAGSVIVAVGERARDELGDIADGWMPHPRVVGERGRWREAERKIKSLTARVGASYLQEQVIKSAAAQRLTYGIVLEPDVVDAQGDSETPEDIESAAHAYLENSRVVGLQHIKRAPGSVVVESYIAPVDFDVDGEVVKKGSWVMVTRHSPEVWALIERGDLRGYSIGGTGTRETN